MLIKTQALKALREQLTTQTSRLDPPSRFSFSPTSREVFLSSLSTAFRNSKYPDAASNTSRSNSAPTASTSSSENRDNLGALPTFPNAPSRNYNAEMASRSGLGIHRPSFSAARDIDIQGHTNMHILLPATAARATTAGRVAELRSCILDMSVPTTPFKKQGDGNTSEPDKGRIPHPFASLTINDVTGSIVIAGHVNGPAHITGVRDSVLVINARQVRMHECVNVRVFLWCGSRPIIEGCTGVKFAQLPTRYVSLPPHSPSYKQLDYAEGASELLH